MFELILGSVSAVISSLITTYWTDIKHELIAKVRHRMIFVLQELFQLNSVDVSLIGTASIGVDWKTTLVYALDRKRSDDVVEFLAFDNFKIFTHTKIADKIYSHPACKILEATDTKIFLSQRNDGEDWRTASQFWLEGVPYDFNCGGNFDTVVNILMIISTHGQFSCIRQELINEKGFVKTQNTHGVPFEHLGGGSFKVKTIPLHPDIEKKKFVTLNFDGLSFIPQKMPIFESAKRMFKRISHGVFSAFTSFLFNRYLKSRRESIIR